ncbi:helix-turn-helix domain-containing protein [Emcibacteraceae bacterium]|nr:helix-turn-helix domain-containing protein [Emcibacteraceae bacterium]
MGIDCNNCQARNSKLCSVFDGESIAELFKIANPVKVKKGSYLLHEEDSTKYVYNLSSGVSAVERLASDGRRQIMAFIYPGDFIGVSAGPAYSISDRALTDMTACKWHIRDIQALYVKYPELEQRVHEIATRILAATMDQIFVLGRKNAIEKIAYFLLYIDKRQVKFDGHTDEFTLPMTRADIADYLGITIETVSRAFSFLKKKGLIELSQNWAVRLLDKEKLAEIADHYGSNS